MAMKFHVVVFWVVKSCSDMVGYRRFGPRRCRKHGPPKRRYPITSLHDVIT